ncbi:MAG: CRISPR-associated endonuclease Cas2 [Elusimicrobia bacterium]|nr:CRISPR-associated endonuclease Cas2 [Elusimicrobiota bacterium]
MLVVVTYDVNTEKAAGRRRLRRVARACLDFGQRVQKSVFECLVRDVDWVELRGRLLKEMNTKEDSLRFYFIDEAARERIEHHGLGKPNDLDGPLVI